MTACSMFASDDCVGNRESNSALRNKAASSPTLRKGRAQLLELHNSAA